MCQCSNFYGLLRIFIFILHLFIMENSKILFLFFIF